MDFSKIRKIRKIRRCGQPESLNESISVEYRRIQMKLFVSCPIKQIYCLRQLFFYVKKIQNVATYRFVKKNI